MMEVEQIEGGVVVRVRDWAPCGTCDGQLELREEPADDGGSWPEENWVHVTQEGDYVYWDHYPLPITDGVMA
jgi:hypothetical protein